jgi:hypothetical protein
MVFFRLPSGIKTLLHPIICCALSANLSATAYGYLSGSGIDAALGLEFHRISEVSEQLHYNCNHCRHDSYFSPNKWLTRCLPDEGALESWSRRRPDGFSWVCHHIVCILNVQAEKGNTQLPMLSCKIISSFLRSTFALYLMINFFFNGCKRFVSIY